MRRTRARSRSIDGAGSARSAARSWRRGSRRRRRSRSGGRAARAAPRCSRGRSPPRGTRSQRGASAGSPALDQTQRLVARVDELDAPHEDAAERVPARAGSSPTLGCSVAGRRREPVGVEREPRHRPDAGRRRVRAGERAARWSARRAPRRNAHRTRRTAMSRPCARDDATTRPSGSRRRAHRDELVVAARSPGTSNPAAQRTVIDSAVSRPRSSRSCSGAQLGAGGHAVEAADAHVDRMDLAAADHRRAVRCRSSSAAVRASHERRDGRAPSRSPLS